MTEKMIPTSGEESQNDWYACPMFDVCGYIGVHPNGSSESCPDCGSGLEVYSGQLWECSSCGTEFVGRGDAKDCCQ